MAWNMLTLPKDETDDFLNEASRLGYQTRHFLILGRERVAEVPSPIEREVSITRMHNGTKVGIRFVGKDAMRWPALAVAALKSGKLGAI